MPWYKYQPPWNCTSCNPCDPNNYALIGNMPPVCLSPKIYVCAIQAADNMGKPIIPPILCIEILNAINTRTESANVKLEPIDRCPCRISI